MYNCLYRINVYACFASSSCDLEFPWRRLVAPDIHFRFALNSWPVNRLIFIYIHELAV